MKKKEKLRNAIISIENPQSKIYSLSNVEDPMFHNPDEAKKTETTSGRTDWQLSTWWAHQQKYTTDFVFGGRDPGEIIAGGTPWGGIG